MKIDFNEVLKTLKGEEMFESAGARGVRDALVAAGMREEVVAHAMNAIAQFWGTRGAPREVKLTLGRVCAAALQEEKVVGVEAILRMRLAIKVLDDAQPVEVSQEEREKILASVEKFYNNLIYFRVHEKLAP